MMKLTDCWQGHTLSQFAVSGWLLGNGGQRRNPRQGFTYLLLFETGSN